MYRLYDYYGWFIAEIGHLFIAGYASSMLFGTLVGSLCDRAGRRAGCLGYAALYILSCLTKHGGAAASPSTGYFRVLLLGRLTGGISTSLLFSAFDAWMVTEHKRRFEGNDLSQTYSRATIINGLVAVAAGCLGQWASDIAGPVAPFDLAILFLLLGAVLVSATWPENYGDDAPASPHSGVSASLKMAVTQCRADPAIVAVCLLQAFFESAMYTFVFMWTPVVEKRFTSLQPDMIPFGLIFAGFCVSMVCGSALFDRLGARGMRPESMLRGALIASVAAFLVVMIASDVAVTIACFCVFEACCGVYFPSIGMLKAEYLPDSTRATIVNLARVPLNIIVCLTLVHVGDLSHTTVFSLVALWLLLGLASLCRIRHAPKGRVGSYGEAELEGLVGLKEEGDDV